MPKAGVVKDPDTIALERDLSDMLGLKVTIDFHEEGGTLTVEGRGAGWLSRETRIHVRWGQLGAGCR